MLHTLPYNVSGCISVAFGCNGKLKLINILYNILTSTLTYYIVLFIISLCCNFIMYSFNRFWLAVGVFIIQLLEKSPWKQCQWNRSSVVFIFYSFSVSLAVLLHGIAKQSVGGDVTIKIRLYVHGYWPYSSHKSRQ